MRVEIPQEERDLLVAIIEREISELGPEIRHTDARKYRDELKIEKQVLLDLLARLRAAEAVQAG